MARTGLSEDNCEIQSHCVLFCTTQGTGQLDGVIGENWTAPTLPSWLHSIWVGVVDPWIVVSKGPVIWYKTLREIVTLIRMHKVRDSS